MANVKKRYNPNSYNALDASIAFVVVIVLFFIVEKIFSSVVPDVNNRSEDFDYYRYTCISIIVTQALIFAVAFAFSRVRGVDLFSGSGFVYKIDGVGILFAMILTSGIFFLAEPTHLLFTENAFDLAYGYPYDVYTEKVSEIYKGDNFYLFLEIFLLSPLLPAVCEEVLFRGVVMRGLRQFGVAASVILSTLCFTLMHGNIEQIVLQFSIGLAIGAVVSVTKNFLLGAAMHLSNNLFNVLYYMAREEFAFVTNGGEKLFTVVTIIIGIVFAIAGGYYFIRLALKNSARSASGSPRELTLREKDDFALVKRAGEEWQTLYPVQVDIAAISDGSYFYKRNGVEKRINKKSSGIVSAIVLGIGILIAVVLVF